MSETKTTRRRARKLTPQEAAERIFNHIPETGGGGKKAGISQTALAAAAGITRHQVESGINYLREQFPKDPLVSSSKDGYRWTYDPQRVGAFQRWRALSAQTTIMRLWRGVVKPYAEERGVPGQVEFQTRQFERLLEDIGVLIQA